MVAPIIITGPESFKDIDPSNPSYRQYDGLVGFSNVLNSEMLQAAFRRGIFPWSEKPPFFWFFTSPRAVLVPSEFNISHSLRKRIRDAAKGIYRDGKTHHTLEVYLDRNLSEVLLGCSGPRRDQEGTWIGPQLVKAYIDSIKDNFFHTLCCEIDGNVCAGLIFDSIGRIFYGESMFTQKADLSKIALSVMVAIALKEKVEIIDCQDESHHLMSLGAKTISGARFLRKVTDAIALPPVNWNDYRGQSLNHLLQTFIKD